jgi:outer membrane lipoprotein-sorting protein
MIHRVSRTGDSPHLVFFLLSRYSFAMSAREYFPRGLVFLSLLALSFSLYAQEILTAEKFFGLVQDKYGTIADYEGKIIITTNKAVMHGTVVYKSPSMLRIDFTQPPDQVICFDKNTLTVYLPDYRAVLSQSVQPGGKNSGASLASKQGLLIMKKNYTIAYDTGPNALPLEEGSSESVVKLMLARKTVSEGFKSITLSISPESLLIRRIEGMTVANELVKFDFLSVSLNQNVPDARFVYDSPASANLYNNFLFKSDN